MNRNEVKNLFWPIFFEQIFLTFMGNITTVILSGFSDGAVAASGMANQLLLLGFMFLNIISVGATIVLAQVLGQNKKENIIRVERNSIYLSFIFPSFITLIFLIGGDTFLKLMGTPEDIFIEASILTKIISVSIIPQGVTSVISAIFRSHGNTKVSLNVTLIVNIINIIGASLVVYTPFSLIGRGVTGVAMATLIARLIGSIILSIHYINLRQKFKIDENKDINKALNKALNKVIKIDFNIIGRILKLGIPSGLESIFYNFSQTIMAALIATLGTLLITARIYTLTLTSFVFAVSMAVSITSQVVVGNLIGKGKKEEAKKYINKTSLYGFFLIMALSLVVAIFSPIILKVFTNDDMILSLVPKLCLVSIFLEPFRLLNCNFIAGLSSGGDVKYPVILGIIVIYFINIPLSYISVFYFNLGLYGIFICAIIDESIRSLCLKRRWNLGKWKEINILKDL